MKVSEWQVFDKVMLPRVEREHDGLEDQPPPLAVVGFYLGEFLFSSLDLAIESLHLRRATMTPAPARQI